MSVSIVTDLCVPEETISLETIDLIVDLFAAMGLRLDQVPGSGGDYLLDAHLDEPLGNPPFHGWPEARAHINLKVEFGIHFWFDPLSPGDVRDVDLVVGEPPRDGEGSLRSVGLWMYMPRIELGTVRSRQFVVWSTLLASVLSPAYGWGDDQAGLFGTENSPVDLGDVAAGVPQPLEWLNVYGPAYVAQLGMERLLETPAWRVDVLTNGAVILVLSPHPYAIDQTVPDRVADHLGVPLPSRHPPG